MPLYLRILVTEETQKDQLVEYSKILMRLAGHELEPMPTPPPSIKKPVVERSVEAEQLTQIQEKKPRVKKVIVPPPPPETNVVEPVAVPPEIDYLYVLDRISDLYKNKSLENSDLQKILTSLNVESFTMLQSESVEVLTKVLQAVENFVNKK